MKVIKTIKDNKTTTEYKFSGTEITLIFGILSCVKYIVKRFTNKRR